MPLRNPSYRGLGGRLRNLLKLNRVVGTRRKRGRIKLQTDSEDDSDDVPLTRGLASDANARVTEDEASYSPGTVGADFLQFKVEGKGELDHEESSSAKEEEEEEEEEEEVVEPILPLLLVGALRESSMEAGAEISTIRSLSPPIPDMVVGALKLSSTEAGAEVAIASAPKSRENDGEGASGIPLVEEIGDEEETNSIVVLREELDYGPGGDSSLMISIMLSNDDEDNESHASQGIKEEGQHNDGPEGGSADSAMAVDLTKKQPPLPPASEVIPTPIPFVVDLQKEESMFDSNSLADSLTSGSEDGFKKDGKNLRRPRNHQLTLPKTRPSNIEIIQPEIDQEVPAAKDTSEDTKKPSTKDTRDDEIQQKTHVALPKSEEEEEEEEEKELVDLVVDKTLPLVREPPSPLREPRPNSRLRRDASGHTYSLSRNSFDDGSIIASTDGVDSITTTSYSSDELSVHHGFEFHLDRIGSGPCRVNCLVPRVDSYDHVSDDDYTESSVSEGTTQRPISKDDRPKSARDNDSHPSFPSHELEESSLETGMPFVVCIAPRNARQLRFS